MSDEDANTAEPSEATAAADKNEAHAAHRADREPTEEEAKAAPTEVEPGVAEHFEEMNKIGAAQKGEGKVSP
jgi:hypothetical protein